MSDKVVPHVAVADTPPNHCAVYPQLDHNHPKGYFVLGRFERPSPFGGEPYIEDHYLSVEAAQAICRDYADTLNVVSKDAHTLALAELEVLRAKNDELETECNRLDAALSAIDVIESVDFRARKKAGRKPTTPKAA